jgi:hypothetical protein
MYKKHGIKKKCLIIVVLSICFLPSYGFSSDKSELKIKLKIGQKYNVRINTNHIILQSMSQKKESILNRKIYEIMAEVKEVDSNDIISMEITFKATKEQTMFGKETRGYDSTETHDPNDNMANMYSAMIGEKFSLDVTNKGKIVGLDVDKLYLGMAENRIKSEDEIIRNKMKERAQEEIEKINKKYGSRENRIDAIKKQIGQFPVFNKEQIQFVAENILVPFGDAPVGIGDSWQSSMKLLPNLPIKIDGTYSVKDINKTAAILAIHSAIDIKNSSNPVEDQNLGQTKISLKGSLEGALQINPSSGWLLNKKTTLKIIGEEISPAKDNQQEEIMMPLSIESITIVETMK